MTADSPGGNISARHVAPASDARADAALMTALGAAVAGHRLRRVPLQVLRAAHARHDPTGATSSDARTRLAGALDALANTGVVVLPRSPRLYERHLSPPLPHWVERPSAPRSPRQESPVRVWRPELAAAAALASTTSDFDLLARVEAFLRDGGARRPNVPHRERSVEVFGNEKRLDKLLRNRLFTSGTLTLDLLRCYLAPLPLTAQHTGDPGPQPALLIVENHATYASALTLARERARAGRPAVAVGFGSGNQLPKAIGGAAQLDPVAIALWYFGDLDPGGLTIAKAADVAARRAGLPPLRPALPLYRALLADGLRQDGSAAVDEATAIKLASWLGDAELVADAVRVLTAGHRIAQESVGYEAMASLDSWY